MKLIEFCRHSILKICILKIIVLEYRYIGTRLTECNKTISYSQYTFSDSFTSILGPFDKVIAVFYNREELS